jgi:hypothetical protein
MGKEKTVHMFFFCFSELPVHMLLGLEIVYAYICGACHHLLKCFFGEFSKLLNIFSCGFR